MTHPTPVHIHIALMEAGAKVTIDQWNKAIARAHQMKAEDDREIQRVVQERTAQRMGRFKAMQGGA